MNNVMPYPWELPFTIITALFMLVMSGLGLYQWRKWRKEQEQRRAEDAAFAVLMQEIKSQQHADEAAHRILALADTQPLPTLPPIVPASYLDASDTSDDTLMYCPICALEGVRVSGLRDADGYFPLPRGIRVLCSEHTVRWEQRIEGDML